MTYLGIKITRKDASQFFKNERLSNARKLSNMSYSIVARSCNILVVEKSYWKGLGLATVLYGAELLEFTEKDLSTLQTVVNSVYRTILQVPTYAANSALRGEVGAPSSKARDIKIKFLFVKHLLQKNRNQLIKKKSFK